MGDNVPYIIQEKAKGLYEERSALVKRIFEIDRAISDCSSAARLFGFDMPHRPRETIHAQRRSGATTVKTRVLDILSNEPLGITVANLRPLLPGYHEKTIGMTLYRLSVDGVVERIGNRVWKLKSATV